MNAKKEKSRRRKFLILVLIKFPIFILIMGLIFAFALKLIEKYPDPVKDGLQQYLSDSSNTNASIGRIENFSFIPQVKVSLFNITLHNRQNAAEIKASADQIDIAAPFWSGLFGGGKIINLNINNLETSDGYPLPFTLILEQASIMDKEGPDQYGSFFIAEGQYRGQSLFLEAKLEKKEGYYKIPSSLPFSLVLGNRVIKGSLETAYKKIGLDNLVYQVGQQSSQAMTYQLVEDEKYITDNPLSCILVENELKACDRYLNL